MKSYYKILLFFGFIQKFTDELGTGTTFKEISQKSLSKISISIPPLEDQERITENLDIAFTEIKKASDAFKKKLNFKALKSAILAQELQNGI